jgi:hypothetical protein
VLTGRRHILTTAGAVAAVSCALFAAGCSGDESGPPSPEQKAQPPLKPQKPPKDKKKKPAVVHNRWDPIVPGRQLVSEGQVSVGNRTVTHRRVYTVTGVIKKIDGVNATAVLDQDFNGGELSEQATDYHAEDEKGAVYFLGSYTEIYQGGQFVNATDGWLSGINGSKSGIAMKAKPKVGDVTYEATINGNGSPPAKVAKTGIRKCVPFRCFNDVVLLQEGDPPDENKYWAPGAGNILTEPAHSGGKNEVEKLVNFTQLSPRALNEINAEVLKLDKHARQVFPDVYGKSKPAKRVKP